MALSRMSTRGRVTIPKEIRDELGLKPGDSVAFIETESGLLMKTVRGNLLDHYGSVEVEGRQDFGQIREETKKKRGEEWGS